MANTPQQFQVYFTRLLNRAGDRARDVVRLSSLKLLEAIETKSPVGDPSTWLHPERAPAGYTGGQFRANWNYSIGSIDTGTTSNTDITNQSGRSTSYRMGDSIFISNSLPYAARIEYEGWAHTAPEGVVRICALEFEQYVEEIA